MTQPIYIGIPWRDRGDAYRTTALECVKQRLFDITGIVPQLHDGDGEQFSLAAARNKIVKSAQEVGATVIVICDADTLVDHAALLGAMSGVSTWNRVMLPFTLFRALDETASRRVMLGVDPHDEPDIGSLDWSVGGIFVTTPSAWWALGGQDERFTGWGCEDTAFNMVADRLGRSHVRVDGVIHHLWHPSSPDKDERNETYQLNAALLQRYVDATDITHMITERHI